MTYVTTPNAAAGTSPRGILTAITGGLSRFGMFLMTNSAGAARLRQVEALRAKSDAELADMGIARDAIVEHVFRDLYYV